MLRTFTRKTREDQRGAAMMEYVAAVALFAMVSVGAINAFTGAIRADLRSFAGDQTPIVEVPEEETPAPADETPVPADETPVPADETPVPADETPAPDETPEVEEPAEPVVVEKTFDASPGGEVTVVAIDGTLKLVEVDAADRWDSDVLVEKDGEVVVRFTRNRQLITVRIVVVDGEPVATITQTKV